MITKAGAAKIAIQQTLGIPEEKWTPHIGPLTRRAFEALALAPNTSDWPPPIPPMGVTPKPGTLILPLTPTVAERNISERGLALVKHFEGCYNVAYKDGGGVWTIGIGHTGLTHKDGTVYAGRTITDAEALALLDYDMNQSEAAVHSLSMEPLTDDQFAALVSWHFNTGGPKSATLWKKLREGSYYEAGSELLKWNKDNGKEIDGLTRRRMSERRLWEGVFDYIVTLDEFKMLKKQGRTTENFKPFIG